MPLSAAALEPLLQLALVPGIGPTRLTTLIRRFGSASRVLEARPSELSRIPGLGPELVRRLCAASDSAGQKRTRAAMEALRRAGAVAITPDSLAYPEALGVLDDAPYLLFAAGALDLLRAPAIAIVGTRQPTPYGRASAAELSAGLVRRGYVIVSGMARGIDAAAHAAALDAGGGTIGILGHGIDQVYPSENRPLFDRVREHGLLLSEFPPGERPQAGNFPRRNRLISALSRGVLVVEMGTRSGAQHTVNFAAEQGREIFAVPGPIGSAVSAGTNQLIKDGARVVTSVEDILEELEGVGQGARSPTSRASVPPAQPASSPPDGTPLSPDQETILAALSADPLHVDELASTAGMPTPRLLTVLLELELSGQVEALPGKRFRRK